MILASARLPLEFARLKKTLGNNWMFVHTLEDFCRTCFPGSVSPGSVLSKLTTFLQSAAIYPHHSIPEMALEKIDLAYLISSQFSSLIHLIFANAK